MQVSLFPITKSALPNTETDREASGKPAGLLTKFLHIDGKCSLSDFSASAVTGSGKWFSMWWIHYWPGTCRMCTGSVVGHIRNRCGDIDVGIKTRGAAIWIHFCSVRLRLLFSSMSTHEDNSCCAAGMNTILSDNVKYFYSGSRSSIWVTSAFRIGCCFLSVAG